MQISIPKGIPKGSIPKGSIPKGSIPKGSILKGSILEVLFAQMNEFKNN